MSFTYLTDDKLLSKQGAEQSIGVACIEETGVTVQRKSTATGPEGVAGTRGAIWVLVSSMICHRCGAGKPPGMGHLLRVTSGLVSHSKTKVGQFGYV